MTKENENGTNVGFQFRQANNKTKWENFKIGVYNPETKEFLGRTSKSWGQLLLFYTIFYVILAALFAVCMEGLFATLKDNEPSYTLERSLIGTNPGLGFRPISDKPEEGSLIWYTLQNDTSIKKWTDLLDKFLIPYAANQTGGNREPCGYDKPPSDITKACAAGLELFGDCNSKNKYGYAKGTPCVFLKLNKIFNWVPQFFTSPQPGMPEDLNKTITNKPHETNIWVSCHGEGPADKENLNGDNSFRYHPAGFPGFYYPFKNQKDYLSPLVAVEILKPKKNVIINIECRAWAGNIKYVGGALLREGSVHFELMIDEHVGNDTVTEKPETTTTKQ